MKTFNNISNQCFHENKVEKANNDAGSSKKSFFENEKKSFSSQLKFAEKAKKKVTKNGKNHENVSFFRQFGNCLSDNKKTLRISEIVSQSGVGAVHLSILSLSCFYYTLFS